MNRAPILFRVDATPRTGYESLARCLTLAAALQRRRRPVYFMAQLEPATLAFNIKRGGNDWLPADYLAGTEDDRADTLQEIRRLNPAAVIVDAPEASSAYLQAIKQTGVMLTAIDHLAQLDTPADLLINPLLGPGKEAYTFDQDTQVLMGRRFALVRPEIRRIRPTRALEPAMVQTGSGKTPGQHRALIALGEDDPNRQTVPLVEQMMNMPRVGKVDVIVRAHHPDLELLQALAEKNSERLEIALEPAEVSAKLVRCHFAITAGNGWSHELAAIGVPQLLLIQNEAHWPSAQRLEEEGAAVCMGWHESVSAATVRQAVQNLLGDPLERQAMSRCGRQLFDCRGPDRMVNALEIMLHRGQMLELRNAA